MRLTWSILLCCTFFIAGCGGAGNVSSVSGASKLPVANAGGPYIGIAGSAVSMSGNASSDPQGQPLTFAWNFGDNTSGTGVSPTHSYSTTGTYTVSLTVTDTSNLSASASTQTTITAIPKPPVANAGGPYTGIAGTAVIFDGSHSTDPQGQALTYSWNFGDGTSGTGINPTHTYAFQGTFTVSLTTTNTSSLSSTASAIVTIGSAPQSPVANLGGPYSALTGSPISFNSSASIDPQGQTLTYFWNFGDNTTSTSPNPTHTYLVTGVYAVSLTVTNTSNLTGTATVNAVIIPPNGAPVTGIVSSGQQPITNARVYLLSPNTTGYGQASVSLLDSASTGSSDSIGTYTTTNAHGTFTLPGGYACTANTQIYLYVLGGDAGAGPNPSSGLLAAIGKCPGTALSVTVNEASTIAAAYALAGFAVDATHVSSSGTPLAEIGVTNAFATAANLATLSTGLALATTATGNGTAPQSKTNTLANILASCVHTGASCSSLFSFATSDGTSSGTRPADTASAAINVAHHPAANVSGLYSLSTATAMYTPVLSAQPNDLLLGLSFPDGADIMPVGIAIDGFGNVWLANQGGDIPIPYGSIVKISNAGAPLSGANGFTGSGIFSPYGIAIDLSGNAWVTNDQVSNLSIIGGSVTELSNSGAFVSGTSSYGAGNAVEPLGIAIDSIGNAWVGGYLGGDLIELSQSGSTLLDIRTGTFPGPEGVAVDATGNIWAASAGAVVKFTTSDALVSRYTGGGIDGAGAVAIDSRGDVWVTNSDDGLTANNSITKLSSLGVALSPSTGFTGGGLNAPYALAIDGDGNVWATSPQTGTLNELSNSGAPISPSTGFIWDQSLHSSYYGIAIDSSGNVWLSKTGSISDDIYEVVGGAAPVVTPLAAAVKNDALGTRP